ncbi:aldose 1-epimerase family protein [Leifsonia bigeumensis]|uniref:Aldose 1-epimerase family protein n=1 Tax=Leifsonella bigeumensis TaxID=433643 RepID=A0ABP7F8E3_9MICO
MRAPTGEQFELSYSQGTRRSRAIITEVAAALRVLEVDGVEIVDAHPEDTTPPYGSGIVLAPWPNRIRDGVWLLDGRPQQLDLTEPDKNNAIHGLLRSRPYRVGAREEHAITLEATIYPQHGYPFLVDTSVRYELVADGIVVTHRFRNASDAPAPVAVGAHPFFRVGDVPIGELTLTVAAAMRFVTDDRLNPVGEEPVDGTGFDLREGAKVGELDLDTAFGGVLHGNDGTARHRLTAPDGSYAEVWQGADFGFVQAFTPRTYPRPTEADPDALGQAVAIEPMTAPPNAFNSGLGVRWLQPDESWAGSWGVTYGRA